MTSSFSPHIFADLNILHDPLNPKFTSETVKLAVALGFDTVAINVEILDVNETTLDAETATTSTDSSKKKQKGKRQKMKTIPEPFRLDPKHVDQTNLIQNGKKFRQYTRITLGLDDPTMVHNILKHPTILQYDILAVYPKSEQIFNTVINKTDIDMIAVDMTQKNVWISKKNLVQMAVEKGITFEMTYGQALSDSSTRREVFANGRDLFRATKGKGLMFNSRAERPIELRSPYDVANLAILFGMTPEQGRRAISHAPKQLLLHAESKRTIKGVIHVESCLDSAPEKLAKLMKIPEFRVEFETIPNELINDKSELGEEETLSPPKKKKKI